MSSSYVVSRAAPPLLFSDADRDMICVVDIVICCLTVALVNRVFFFFSSRRRHTRCLSDWSSDVCSSDLRQLRRHSRESPGERTLRSRGGRVYRRKSQADWAI